MYTKMKDSDIEWIGQIPEHWEVVPVKYHFINKKEIVGKQVDNYERLALTLKGVIKRSKDDSEGLQPEKFETYQIIKKNYLIFKLIDLENIRTSRVGLSKYEGLVSPAYIPLISNGDILPEYAEKYFLNMWYQHIFNQLGSAGVRSNLNKEDLLNLPIIKPPRNEQNKISKFLDNRINLINDAIDKLTNLIKKYDEYKQSLIIEIVTKGLDDNVIMKDSGINYIGEINSDWEFTKIKYVCTKLNRNIDEDILLICSNSGKVFVRNEKTLGLVSDDNKMYQGVKNGDLLIHGMDTWHGAIAVSNFDGKCTKVVHVCDSKHNKEFIAYYMRLLAFKKVYKPISGGIRENTSDFRSWDKASEIYIVMPSLLEQNKIVEYLNEKCNLVDSIINEKEKLINELEGYKKSLIFEYVTGKKEVQK